MTPERNDLLPLPAPAFAVLCALAAGPKTGVDIMDAANSTLKVRKLLGPGTLYRVLRDLRGSKLIARGQPPAGRAVAADDRFTYHVLTALGRDVLKAESDRLHRTLAFLDERAAPFRR